MSHDDTSPVTPQLRASDADRQRAIAALTNAWSDGRITRDEFQERSPQAFDAVFQDELTVLLADIGGLAAQPGAGLANGFNEPLPYQPPVAATGEVSVYDSWQSDPKQAELLPAVYAPEGTKGSSLSIGILSGISRVSEWTVAPNHVSIALMGGTTIDLRDVIFTNRVTVITCIALMGGTNVIVPPEMDVTINGFGFMGGFGWDKSRDVKATKTAPEGNPRVIINGFGFWGGVSIIRRERGEEDISTQD